MSAMKHLYKCSFGHLFISTEDDEEASCTDQSDGKRCGLMGWHDFETCKCHQAIETTGKTEVIPSDIMANILSLKTGSSGRQTLEVPIQDFFMFINPLVREQCVGLFEDKKELFAKMKGSKRNHQPWAGGYGDHITECLNIALNLYYSLDSARPVPFLLEDALFTLYIHDLEKLYPDQVDNYQQNTGCTPKEAKKKVREGLFQQFGFADYIERNPSIQTALLTVEGENDLYSPNRRIMNELGAFCHCVDTLSSRLWYDFPKLPSIQITTSIPDPSAPEPPSPKAE